jgi:hypothetical protein
MTETNIAMSEAAGEGDEDLSLILWMLSLTPEERLQVLQGFVDSVGELRDARAAAL